MLYWNLEQTKEKIPKPWQKVGVGPRPGPGSGQTTTEMTHHGLNQSLIFLQWHGECLYVHMLELFANARMAIL